MSICDTCRIEEKLAQCCGRYPPTGESLPLELKNGDVVMACPYLSQEGQCSAYEQRPQGCREFLCNAYTREEWRLDRISEVKAPFFIPSDRV